MREKLFLVTGLFLVAPLIGEFLNGDLPITIIWGLPILGTMYGCGCIIIRETSCRLNLNWHGRLLLCLAYGIIEEAFVSQTLFNPNYMGFHPLEYGYIPCMGISLWWTIYVLSLHSIWSTAVPIALIESFTSKLRNIPWINKKGYIITIIVFIMGCAFLSYSQYKWHMVGSVLQLTVTGILAVLLVLLAIFLSKIKINLSKKNFKIPNPLIIFCLFSGFGIFFLNLIHERKTISPAVNVVLMISIILILGCIIFYWSRSVSWNEFHKLSVLSGLLVAYAWFGFRQPGVLKNVSAMTYTVGNTLFTLIIISIMLLLWVKAYISYNLIKSVGFSNRDKEGAEWLKK